jgi:hypothetical protein
MPRALFAVLVQHMKAFLEAHCATFAAPVMQAATMLIADAATERGSGFSAETTSVSSCHAAGGIPLYDITPRGERQ